MSFLGGAVLLFAPLVSATPMQIYGVWHCGNDACIWGAEREASDFDAKNHWLIDRGDGAPAVNLVVLSFVDPLKLLHRTSDAHTRDGVPIGMSSEIIRYFTRRGIRVQLSMGGISYVGQWNKALDENPRQLGINAARAAKQLGVGIEIDYEEDKKPRVKALGEFIAGYRSEEPYDSSGGNPAARLTIDLGSGNGFLTAIAAQAGADWLRSDTPVLDYANAMVPEKQPPSAAAAQADWLQHIGGSSEERPQVPAVAPAKLTGSFYLLERGRPAMECTSFAASLEASTRTFVETVAPAGAGTTPGMLGYMFWAAECPSKRGVCTVPPNTCQGGVGAGARAYNIPVPMPPLRQN